MKKLPPDLLGRIKDSVNLLEVVGEHVVLRKVGGNHVGLCPFHAERSPSFSVSESKQLYHCYGCNRGGDLLRFVMDLHGLSFIDAVRELAERGNISIPSEYLPADSGSEGKGEQRGDASEGATMGSRSAVGGEGVSEVRRAELAYKLNRFVARFYHQNLQRDAAAQTYLLERNLPDEIRRDFYIGASSSNWSDLSTFLEKSGAPMDLAVELGLIRRSMRSDAPMSSRAHQGAEGGVGGAGAGSRHYDFFRSRILFPILDMRGRVCAFGGRILPSAAKDAEGREQAKYINSAESLVFSKSKQVFGLFQAQKHIRAANEVILVEGYFDVTALHSIGIRNAVATCGTALTLDHLQLLKKFAAKVTVLFDSDRAGVAATERAMLAGLELGMVIYGVSLSDLGAAWATSAPGGGTPGSSAGLVGARGSIPKDPDEWVKVPGGLEALQHGISKARPILDQSLERALQEAQATGGPEAISTCLKTVGGWLRGFADPIGKKLRMQQVAQALGVNERLVMEACGQQVGPAAKLPSPVNRNGLPVNRSASSLSATKGLMQASERTVLEGMLRGGDSLVRVLAAESDLPKGWTIVELFDSPAPRHWLNTLLGQQGGLIELEANPVRAMDGITDPGLKEWVRTVLMRADLSPAVPS